MTTSPLDVYIRFRPAAKTSKDIQVEPNNQNLSVINPINSEKIPFTFNEIMQSATQEEVYDKICKNAVKHVLDGYNSCVLATGMTSAGKSYSIVGDEALTYKTRGMIARSIEDIFKHAECSPGISFDIKFSVIEILNDKLIDLLISSSSTKYNEVPNIQEIQGKQKIKNLSEIKLNNVSEGLELLFGAEQSRTIGKTSLNSASSRSHVIYIVSIRQSSRVDETASATESKLYLVDLAGTEKLQSDLASAYINKSLAALELCISGLAQNLIHIPFRQSKLTHILRDCLGGSSKTTLIACIRPEQEFMSETIQTLRFAQRAVNIKTEATVNVISRMFEASKDVRTVNSQVAGAVAEALESQGGIGQLQARVLRELEAENKKLKAEIMLVTGAEAKFEAADQDGLRRAIDAWTADSSKLPELNSRADYMFCLEYMKQKLQTGRTQSQFSKTQNLPQPLPQIAGQSGQGPPSGKTAKTPRQMYGTIADTGALAVATNKDVQLADSLKPASPQKISSPVRQSMAGSVMNESESDKFKNFVASPSGQDLSTMMQDARAVTKTAREEYKQIKDEIAKLFEGINQKKTVLTQKTDAFKQNGGQNSDQNILNYQQSQNQVKLLGEITQLATEIKQMSEKTEVLSKNADKVEQMLDMHKVQEEHCRRKMLTAFEGFCAGLNKKTSLIEKNEQEDKENKLYETILNRTKQRK